MKKTRYLFLSFIITLLSSTLIKAHNNRTCVNLSGNYVLSRGSYDSALTLKTNKAHRKYQSFLTELLLPRDPVHSQGGVVESPVFEFSKDQLEDKDLLLTISQEGCKSVTIRSQLSQEPLTVQSSTFAIGGSTPFSSSQDSRGEGRVSSDWNKDKSLAINFSQNSQLNWSRIVWGGFFPTIFFKPKIEAPLNIQWKLSKNEEGHLILSQEKYFWPWATREGGVFVIPSN